MGILSKEAKIGFVIGTACLVLLGLAPSQRKRAPIIGSRYELVFHDLEGLQEGDQVVVGGVDAGRVTNIDFAPQDKWKELNPPGIDRPVVLVTVALRPGFPLSQGTGYKVVSTLRGNRFINILPSPPTGERVQEGTILSGELPPETADQLQMTLANFKNLSKSTKKMRDQFADPLFRRDMKDLASNMRFYSVEFARVSKGSRAQINRMAAQFERYERQAIAQVQRMDAQVSAVGNFTRSLTPKLRARIQGYNQRIASGQQQLDRVYAQSNSLLQNFRGYADRMQAQAANFHPEKVAERLDKINERLETYADLATDLHQITSDPGLKQDLKALPRRMRERSERLKGQVEGYRTQLNVLQFVLPLLPPDPRDAAPRPATPDASGAPGAPSAPSEEPAPAPPK
jgi:hypothetical protein